jgi:hypothetical protein
MYTVPVRYDYETTLEMTLAEIETYVKTTNTYSFNFTQEWAEEEVGAGVPDPAPDPREWLPDPGTSSSTTGASRR